MYAFHKKIKSSFSYIKYGFLQYSKKINLLLLAIFALLLFLIYGLFLRLNYPIGISFKDNEQLYLLIHINILLISVLTFVMLRLLAKLLYERYKKTLGFKLRGKLVGAFLVVGFMPILLFFYITNDFFSSKIARWFRPQTSITLDNTIDLLQKSRDQRNKALNELPDQLARQLRFFSEKSPLNSLIKENLSKQPIGGITIYNSKGVVLYSQKVSDIVDDVWKPMSIDRLKEIGDKVVSMKDANNVSYRVRSFIGGGKSKYYLEIYADEKLLGQSDTNQTLQDLTLLQQSLGSSRALNVNYKVILLFISILIIFTLIWFAFYLTRTIIGPVQKLLYGMNQVKEGNFHVRIETSNDNDELKMLLNSFNLMVIEHQKKSLELKQRDQELSKFNLALLQKNKTLEVIFSSIKIGAVIVSQDGKIQEINEEFCKLFYLGKKNYLGANFKSAFPEDLQIIFLQGKEMINSGNVKNIEKSFNFNWDEKEFNYKVAIFSIADNYSNLVVVQDVTELDNLAKATAWQEVARRIAHEIKNPLTPIRLSAERIINKYYLKDPEKFSQMKDMADTIINEVDFLKKLINEFSNFARLPKTNLEKANIAEVLTQVENFYSESLPKNIELQIKIAENLPKILMDANQIKQALLNLTQNSINSLSSVNGGKIILEVTAPANKNILNINVIDNGPGIDSKLLHKIFEPYVTTRKDGTGLGLAIVQRIILDHHGKIDVSSNKELTTFKITLPLTV